MAHALDLLRACPCDAGCPSCSGPVGETGERGKEAASRILAEMLKEE
jgi:DEAD/DEAH box helicase domain-containing protein